ncbi:MAG: type II secretion system protein GspK [Pseudobdellovibrionaceae bacterium]|nr:type II secretion system protein GspK [Pseudobdellovibrionaceae bacterium]
MKKPRLTSSFPWPKTFLGFPVGEPRSGEPATTKDRGIAMIVVMFMITLMALFSADMIVNSAVDAELAAGSRNNLKAEYIAKSGANLATFLLMADLAIDMGQYEMTQGKASISDSPTDFWGMLNGFPIGADTMEMAGQMQETFDLSKISDSAVLDSLKQFDGHFTLNVADESSKLNINSMPDNTGNVYSNMFKAMMSCPAEKDYLDKKKVNVPELVAYIRDWADKDERPNDESAKSSEDDVYADRVPKIKAKNAPFDSLDELRMIPGWDVDMHAIFSPLLTVYPIPVGTGKNTRTLINFNTASREFLGCLFPKSTTDCAEKAMEYRIKSDKDGPLAGQPEIQQTLKESFCADSPESEEIINRFTYRSDLYRVKVQAEVFGQSKTLEVVLQRKLPGDDDVKNQYKAAYRYLYWKML